MEDREAARMRKYGESKTTRIMMANVPYVTSGSGLRKFQADGFLLTRVYQYYVVRPANRQPTEKHKTYQFYIQGVSVLWTLMEEVIS